MRAKGLPLHTKILLGLLIGAGFILIAQLGVALVADPVLDATVPAPPCTPCRNTLTRRP